MSRQQVQGADEAIDLNNELKTRREELVVLRGQDVASPNGFHRDYTSDQLHTEFDAKDNDESAFLNVRIAMAGRMMTHHVMSKASFVTLRDVGSRTQLCVARDDLPEGVYSEQFEKQDLDDIVVARDELFKTQTDELSVHCTELRLLTKALCPLPDRFHSLQGQEIRYHRRYLDLTTDEESRHTFRIRPQILATMRQFVVARGFMEVKTPVMQVIPGGASARPFIIHHNALDLGTYLRIAPELCLKRLVVGGFEHVFEISRNFRNGGISVRHNPESTTMELYMTYTDCRDLIELTESLFRILVQTMLGKIEVPYDDQVFDSGKPFEKLTMREVIKKHHPEINVADPDNFDAVKAPAESLGIQVKRSWGLGRIVIEIFDEAAETHPIRSTFIIEYSAEVSLSVCHNGINPEITDRFEFFIGGREIGNGSSESNDAEGQAQYLQGQVNVRATGDDGVMFCDEDYIVTLEYGLPPTADLGIGIDRTMMPFTNSHATHDVILLPVTRPWKQPAVLPLGLRREILPVLSPPCLLPCFMSR